MKTAIDYAHEINQLKPDLKEFWVDIESDMSSAFNQLCSQPANALTLFKLELIAIYQSTNPRIWASINIEQHKFILESANLNSSLYTRSNSYGSVWYPDLVFNLSYSDNLSEHLILAHVDNPRQYLNKYLKSKTRTPGSTKLNQTLADNVFSFTAFKTWLSKQKPLNSVQAEDLLKQIKAFEQTRSDYFDLILSHTPKPSIKLRKFIADCPITYSKSNFILINRYSRWNLDTSNVLLLFNQALDNRDSDYKPIILGMPLYDSFDEKQFISLLSNTMIRIHGQSDTQVIEYCLKQLNASCCDESRAKYKQILSDFKHTIDQTLEKLND